MLTLNDLLTSSGRYPDRANSPELTDRMKNQGAHLLDAVNDLMFALGVKLYTVSSGFRPTSINSQIKNASKQSLHMKCEAVDLLDRDGSLAKLIATRPDLLITYQLWLEDPAATKGWTHLDIGTRKDRPIRIFKP